jgi:hypothetical protein
MLTTIKRWLSRTPPPPAALSGDKIVGAAPYQGYVIVATADGWLKCASKNIDTDRTYVTRILNVLVNAPDHRLAALAPNRDVLQVFTERGAIYEVSGSVGQPWLLTVKMVVA